MGTRSLTYVYNEKHAVVCMYRQMDGYPAGHGAELAEFLDPMVLVNGINSNETRKVANGMDCLAAQLVAHFKTGAGDFYLMPPKSQDCGQDYEYHIHKDRVTVYNYDGDQIFGGTWKEFSKFCKDAEAKLYATFS